MLQRRTPLKRTGGLKAKRAGPRTGRMKPNARFPDAKVKAYWSSLERRCVVCKSTQDTVLHHILARLPQKLRQRDHRFVAILCAAHHNMGDDSVHLLGSEAAFQHRHGVDLVQIAVDNWEAFRSEEHTSELQSLMRISYAVFCLKKTKQYNKTHPS